MAKLISPHAVARRLGLSEETVRRLLRSGEINGRKFGQQWRVDPDDLSLSHGGTTTPNNAQQGAQKPTS
jgi:excisionase family DNA binding protein